LIFNELVEGMDARNMNHATDIGWMIDASHNVKDPIEDLLQSVQAIKIAYAQALLVDKTALKPPSKTTMWCLHKKFCNKPIARMFALWWQRQATGRWWGIRPVTVYRQLKVRENLIKERGLKTVATGL
jgi:L-rhamnose isomerase/sugar isomerase